MNTGNPPPLFLSFNFHQWKRINIILFSLSLHSLYIFVWLHFLITGHRIWSRDIIQKLNDDNDTIPFLVSNSKETPISILLLTELKWEQKIDYCENIDIYKSFPQK